MLPHVPRGTLALTAVLPVLSLAVVGRPAGRPLAVLVVDAVSPAPPLLPVVAVVRPVLLVGDVPLTLLAARDVLVLFHLLALPAVAVRLVVVGLAFVLPALVVVAALPGRPAPLEVRRSLFLLVAPGHPLLAVLGRLLLAAPAPPVALPALLLVAGGLRQPSSSPVDARSLVAWALSSALGLFSASSVVRIVMAHGCGIGSSWIGSSWISR